jgi:RimJ/RimL family protein N-acetyltransferase
MVMEMAEDERETRIDCPVLVTERLVMRPPHREDVTDLAVLANNRRVAEMLARMPHPYGKVEA